MSEKTLGINRTYAVAPHGAMNVIFWIIAFALLPVVALFGGMQFLVLGLAVGLSVLVWIRPQEAPAAGMLFLFAAGILLPYGARFDPFVSAQEMFYWASGLFVITLAAILRIGLRSAWMIPSSAKALLLVALAAALYGVTHGASASYALRQLYGVLLLVAYLAIAANVGDLELVLRRIQTFGVLCAVCFFIYYAAVFAEYGFHKEIGYNGTQASFLAIVLMIAGVERKKGTWILGSLTILLVAALVFMRKDILTFLMALAIAFAMKFRSKVVRLVCFVSIGVIALIALFPPVTQIVSENLIAPTIIGDIIPLGSQDATTLYERSIQLGVALATVQSHPLLGEGLGSPFQFESLAFGPMEVHYLDSGWGYLLQKMGLLGAAVFLWFLVTVFKSISRKSVALSACLLAATIVTMFSEPVFLHFTTAPSLGTFAGLLLGSSCMRRSR